MRILLLLLSCASAWAQLKITTTDIAPATLNSAYTTTFAATGGTAPYTWSITSGALPTGLTLTGATGVLAGTPTVIGWSGLFTVRVTDNVAATAALPFSLSVAPALDIYGGRNDVGCTNGTGAFKFVKISTRWVLCDPLDKVYFLQAVGGILSPGSGTDATTGQTFNYDGVATTKYGNLNVTWGPQMNRRLLNWGFNAVGPQVTDWVAPYQTSASWPGDNTQPVKLPVFQTILVSNYALVNLWGFSAGPVKDIMAGVNYNYNNYRKASLDALDTNLYGWANAYFASVAGQTAFTSPYTLGLLLDDTDYMRGLGAGPDFVTTPAGFNDINPAYLMLLTSPLQTYHRENNETRGIPMFYGSNSKVYSKTAAASPPVTCAIATPCTLRDYLSKKYSGSISSLNTAWGSNYTTFDSSGTTRTAESVGAGNGSNKSFTHTITHTSVSPLSMLIKVNGTPVAGDCPWFADCQITTANIGVMSVFPDWQSSHQYDLGNVIKDSNGYVQKATSTTGTSKSGAAPTWNTTAGGSTTDGTVTWQNQGPGLLGGSVTPYLPFLVSQSCPGCNLPSATYQIVAVAHMSSGFSNPSELRALTVSANTQVIAPSPASVPGATGWDVYAFCQWWDAPGGNCVMNGTTTTPKLQASNIPFGTDWTSPSGGLNNMGAALPDPPSSVNYSTGAMSLEFAVAPANGAAITVDYVENGWMYGTGLMDEDGRNTSWVGTNWVCFVAATACNGITLPVANANATLGADMDAWIPQYFAAYFSNYKTALGNTFPNLTYWGADAVGTWNAPARKEVLQGAAPYLDTLYTAALPITSQIDYQVQHFGDKPLVVGGTYFSATPDSALFRYGAGSDLTAGWTNQEGHGQNYKSALNGFYDAHSTSGIYPFIGSSFWGLFDFWNEKTNWGLISLSDNPYDGKSACQATRTDPWGYATGGEEVVPSWAAMTSYSTPGNGPRSTIQVNISGTLYYFRPTAAGTSSGSPPAWPTTQSATVTDGTVTWQNLGIKAYASCYGDAVDYAKGANAYWYTSAAPPVPQGGKTIGGKNRKAGKGIF